MLVVAPPDVPTLCSDSAHKKPRSNVCRLALLSRPFACRRTCYERVYADMEAASWRHRGAAKRRLPGPSALLV